MATELSKEQLQRLARLGAAARLEELEAERKAILHAFPGIAAQAARQAKLTEPGVAAAPADGEAGNGKAEPRRARKRKVTAAQRKAQSQRMKKFWADRKKAQA